MSAVAVQLEETALAWVDVCALDDILPDTGVAALVGGRQIAIVRVGEGVGDGAEVYALDNFDPFSHAFVIARGIVGDRQASPRSPRPSSSRASTSAPASASTIRRCAWRRTRCASSRGGSWSSSPGNDDGRGT